MIMNGAEGNKSESGYHGLPGSIIAAFTWPDLEELRDVCQES
jgi:hypothetical protein